MGDLSTLPEAVLKVRELVDHAVADPSSSNDDRLTEERMRRALGLSGPSRAEILTTRASSPRQVTAERSAPSSQDAGVAGATDQRADPTSPLRQRIAAQEQVLAAERRGHDETRHLLQQAKLRVQALETRTQHDALAQEEALSVARRATTNAQRALDDALFEAQQRHKAERLGPARQRSTTSPPTAHQAGEETAKPTHAAVAAAQTPIRPAPTGKRGRPRTRPVPEPKPVRWWTPSYRAGTKG